MIRGLQFLVLTVLAFSFSATAEEKKPFKIGAMLCLTGACMEEGTNALRGLQMAQEEINAKGGVLGRQIDLVIQDTREMESPANAVSAYRHLRLDPEITYYVGPSWSVGGLPVAPIIAREPVIAVSPSIGLEDFNEAGDNIFNLWPHDSVSTKALAKYAIDHGWKRAAVISNSNPWESALAKVFREEYKRIGGVETVFIELHSDDQNLRPVALRVKNAKPDVIFMSNYSQLALSARAYKEIGLQAPMMTILLNDTEIKNAQGTLEGILFAVYEEQNSNFRSRYLERHKSAPGMASDTGYDIPFVLSDAITRASSFDIEKVKPALLKTDLTGASGKIIFDSKGGVVKSPIFKALRDNERVAAPE